MSRIKCHHCALTLIRTDPVPPKIPDSQSARVFARRSAVSPLGLVLGGLWVFDLCRRQAAARSRRGSARGEAPGAGWPVLLW